MRSDRVSAVALSFMVLAAIGCRDMIQQVDPPEETEPFIARIAVIDDTFEPERFYQAVADLIVYDDQRPLETGGYATVALSTPDWIEIPLARAGTYDIALLHKAGRLFTTGLPNIVMEDVDLPGEVEIRTPAPRISGNVTLPTGLSSAALSRAEMRFAFDVTDVPFEYRGRFWQEASVQPDGSFTLRREPGAYDATFDITGADTELVYSWEQPVQLDEASVNELSMQLQTVVVDYSTHPDVSDDILFRVRVNRGTVGIERVSSRALPLADFPVSLWALDGWSQVTVTAVNIITEPARSWIELPQSAGVNFVTGYVRFSLHLIDLGGSSVEGHPVRISTPDYVIFEFVDEQGMLTTYVRPGPYRLEISGLPLEIIEVTGDVTIERTVPDSS